LWNLKALLPVCGSVWLDVLAFMPAIFAVVATNICWFLAVVTILKLFCPTEWAYVCSLREVLAAEKTGSFHKSFLLCPLLVENFLLDNKHGEQPCANRNENYHVVPKSNYMQ
jgi:hypothetical protein